MSQLGGFPRLRGGEDLENPATIGMQILATRLAFNAQSLTQSTNEHLKLGTDKSWPISPETHREHAGSRQTDWPESRSPLHTYMLTHPPSYAFQLSLNCRQLVPLA
ncbi:hypothetical protein SRHO_G00155480 [Serrasalmus rhombeus]